MGIGIGIGIGIVGMVLAVPVQWQHRYGWMDGRCAGMHFAMGSIGDAIGSAIGVPYEALAIGLILNQNQFASGSLAIDECK